MFRVVSNVGRVSKGFKWKFFPMTEISQHAGTSKLNMYSNKGVTGTSDNFGKHNITKGIRIIVINNVVQFSVDKSRGMAQHPNLL